MLSGNLVASGDTFVGSKVFIGMSATLKERINIGDNAVIAMGFVVIKDVAANSLI